MTPEDPEWADVQLFADSYQRRQEWIAGTQAKAIAIALGLATPVPQDATPQRPPPPARPGDRMRGNGKTYRVISPMAMLRAVNKP